MDGLGSADVLLFEGFRFDLDSGDLFRLDEAGIAVPVVIGSRALGLLRLLIERQGKLVSKDAIMEAVWPGTVVEEGNLTVQMAALRRIVDQNREQGSCIQTVPGRGYRFVAPVTQSDTEAHPAIPSISQRGTRPRPRLSIVVLPFTNLSDDRQQQYLADGITDDLTTDLSRITGMFVISRCTAFTYQDKPVDAKQIGRELGVRYLLEGSVRRLGNQIRVNVQLIDTETDAHLWAERFDRGTGDLFALQNEITGRIAVELNLQLIGAEAARPTENLDAVDYIFRGRAALSKPATRDNSAEAISLFERALALDPRSAEARSLLAIALATRVLYQMTGSAAGDIARAEGLVGRALSASPRSLFAHYAKAQLLRVQHRWEEAIPEYETALALDRSCVHALHHLGQCKLLVGSIEEAIPLQERAIRLSPRDPFIGDYYFGIATVHLLQLRIDEAILWLEKARATNSEHPALHAHLASAYALKGEIQRAAAELAEARRLGDDGRFASIARLKAMGNFGVPTVRALFETTYFAGLRKAGMPEE
jgi:TolB-like protein/Flp pilus assembly protein TadD